MECASLNLHQAAARAHTTPKIIIAWIRDGLLAANWTQHGWMVDSTQLDKVASKIWKWAA